MTWEITLSPQVGQMTALTVSVAGSVITITGDELDLTDLADGDTIDAEAIESLYVEDRVTRSGETIHIRLLFPIRHGASEAACFPAPITVTTDGPVVLPANGDA